jgi:hypothetical protein
MRGEGRVGWVERSEIHGAFSNVMGFAALNPFYAYLEIPQA